MITRLLGCVALTIGASVPLLIWGTHNSRKRWSS